MNSHAFRLNPNDFLKESLLEYANSQFFPTSSSSVAISSLYIQTVVGSVYDVTLRLANASSSSKKNDDTNNNNASNSSMNDIKHFPTLDKFEIVSLIGTFAKVFSENNATTTTPKIHCHLHLSIADKDGNVYGGHLIEAKVYTTVEVVLGSIPNVEFQRVWDETTGFLELKVVDSNTSNTKNESHAGTAKSCNFSMVWSMVGGILVGTGITYFIMASSSRMKIR